MGAGSTMSKLNRCDQLKFSHLLSCISLPSSTILLFGLSFLKLMFVWLCQIRDKVRRSCGQYNFLYFRLC